MNDQQQIPWPAIQAAIDAAHAADPQRSDDGSAAELLYADRVEAWVARLLPEAGPFARLAGRCQHLERWASPREDYPMDRAGYLRWRRDLAARQGDRAAELAGAAGLPAEHCEHLRALAAKRAAKGDPLAQAMEDAACLVFLEHHALEFAAGHEPEKVIAILRKTWGKMSEQGQREALALNLHPAVADFVGQALSGA